jgi:group II intron reverse transcriptase/maturase
VENFREAFRSLDGSKAIGIDGITKREYGENLEANLQQLENRIHRGTYRPSAKREVLIPKANGKDRPIAIATFEDKLVEWIVGRILTNLYEPLFHDFSHGFRPRKSAYQAVKHLYLSIKDNKRANVVEVDFANFFNSVPHRPLIKILEKRITDKRFTSLISRLLEAEVMNTNGESVLTEEGTPQGSIASPILANVFLHHVVDEWFKEIFYPKNGVIVRYADDVVYSFTSEEDAREFSSALRKRVENYGLKVNEEKSGYLHFSPKSGKVFHFLGFTFYWGLDRGSSTRRLRVKTSKTTLYKKSREYEQWLKENRVRHKIREIWEITAAKLRGHYNYYGIHTNRPKLVHYYFEVVGALFKWLNRRSQRRSYTWDTFKIRLANDPLPLPPPVQLLKPLIDRRLYAN